MCVCVCVCVCVHARIGTHSASIGHVQFLKTSWTVAHQAPLSMEFSSQEYWGWLPFPALRDVPDPGIEFEFLAYPEWTGRFFTIEPPENLQRVSALGKNMYRKQHSEYRVVRLNGRLVRSILGRAGDLGNGEKH